MPDGVPVVGIEEGQLEGVVEGLPEGRLVGSEVGCISVGDAVG